MQISAIATATAAPAPAKVTFTDAAALGRAVDLLGRIIERRSTVPILACVLIQPCEGGAMLSATDLDIEATAIVPALWEGAATAAVELSVIASALSAMPRKGCFEPMLHINPGDRAQLDIGRARYRLALGDIDQFPCLSSPDFPLSGELAPPPVSAETPARAPRAVRERLVLAYLRVRQERVFIADKRRRAVMLARDLQNQVRYEKGRADRERAKRSVAVLRSGQYHERAKMAAVKVAGAEHRMMDAITTAGVDHNRRLATQRLLLAQRDKLRASQREAADLSTALVDATERLERVNAERAAALVALGEARARPLHLGNEVRPDDIQRLQAMLAQRTAERDEARQANAMREAATALKDGETARAVDRMESAMLDATRRALAAENALRAIEARQLRAGAPYSMASPAVHWQVAA